MKLLCRVLQIFVLFLVTFFFTGFYAEMAILYRDIQRNNMHQDGRWATVKQSLLW